MSKDATTHASPRPWRVDDSAAHERFGRKFVRIRDANGQSITVEGKGRLFAEDAALIVDAVNAIDATKKLSIQLYDPIRRAEAERDRLRDLVKRLANSLQGIMDAAEGKGEGVLDESLLVEARAAIGGEAE